MTSTTTAQVFIGSKFCVLLKVIVEETKFVNIECCVPIWSVLDQGLGLAMWKTGDTYKDIKFLANQINDALYTALNNFHGNECNNADKSCDGKLVIEVHT